ncbi:hypothetical protein BIW11_01322 [Tropilaelaps mercedesae]|uniref:Uncharacterized protein n=1 Tax=Tropilaelaps mercedesae TaxID=418985 RepID=A0A1V9XFQ3_9ACAR|nr:hypothetical protein BIW11_01322 [Tropilaelaps mercedesae]
MLLFSEAMRRCPFKAGVAVTLAVMLFAPPATPLASTNSFNRRFDQCILAESLSSRRPLTQGQVVPAGMTMNSFINAVDAIEKKIFGRDPTADRTAITLLHWFSMPDIHWADFDGRFKQHENHRFRYEFIERLFADAIAQLAIHGEFEDKILGQDDLNDVQQDQLCFLMHALSHTINQTCARDRNQGIYSSRTQQSPQSLTWQRGRPPTNSNFASSNQLGSSSGYPGGVPNLRAYQNGLQPHASEQDCEFREDGVVSITGRRGEAISVAPVLMGIAAAKFDNSEKTLFSQAATSYVAKDRSGQSMNPLLMGTLGQEIGFAAFFKRLQERQKSRGNFEFPMTGQWNQTGCLTAFLLSNQQNQPVGLTAAQVAGAVDGFILGSALRSAQGGILDRLSLADLLRLYYSNNQNTVQFPNGIRSRLSVCERVNIFTNLESPELKMQAKLMAYGLALRDGNVFYPENRRDPELPFENSEIDRYVEQVYANLHLDSTMTELNDELCRPNTPNAEQCVGVADVYVLLDAGVVGDSSKKTLQADILGHILNGMDFRRYRNAVQVFARKADSALLRLPERDTANITASGCPACIAQYLDRFVYGYGKDGDAELILALNETLKQDKELQMRNPQPATPARVALYFRLSDEPINDPDKLSEALVRLRFGHPELNIIGIGDGLKTFNDRLGTMKAYSVDELLAQGTVSDGSRFFEIRQAICETPINLLNPACLSSYVPAYRGRGSSNDVRAFSSGVEAKRVQFISYAAEYFSASEYMRIKFTPASGQNIRVCDASWRYDYNRGSGGYQSLVNGVSQTGRSVSNTNHGPVNVNSDSVYGNRDDRPVICQETNNYCKCTGFGRDPDLRVRSIYYNYSVPCRVGPHSCASIRFAVVGLEGSNANQRGRVATRLCKDDFCISPLSIHYSVQTEGMTCSASPLATSSVLVAVVFVMFLRDELF